MATSPGPLPTPVVPVAWLRDALERPDGKPVVLDVRWTLRPPPRTAKERKAAAKEDPPGLVEHDAGHIPGAVYVDLDTELAGPPGPAGRHPLPDPDVLEETLQRAGAGADSEIVVYDGGDGMAAARAWWVLRWAGIEDVSILDGGFAEWDARGFPTVAGPGNVVVPRQVDVSTGHLPTAEMDEVRNFEGVLIDARSQRRFQGRREILDLQAGHIPGAVNLPMGLMQHGDGTFRSPDEIRGLAAEAGIDGSTVVATSCGSGVTASQMVLALATAGLDATPYIGSWSEWITDPERPVATVTG